MWCNFDALQSKNIWCLKYFCKFACLKCVEHIAHANPTDVGCKSRRMRYSIKYGRKTSHRLWVYRWLYWPQPLLLCVTYASEPKGSYPQNTGYYATAFRYHLIQIFASRDAFLNSSKLRCLRLRQWWSM